jgi:16S rRNA (guanine527-N7)-methyltransferase
MTHRRILSEGSRDLGIALAEPQLDAFLVYLVELDKWNRKINLTSIRDEREIVIKHFLDSLAYLKNGEISAGAKLLDMGSGAGFPALPIKIARPDLMVTMVESVKKKTSFLRHIIRTLQLSHTAVLDVRTNELAETSNAQYDVVTARAFASMEKALEEGSRFLKTGGMMILSRGPEEEIDDQAMERNSVAFLRRFDLVLPSSEYRRSIWTFVRM